ncbi:protein ASPARTIC PROTEASE IN GUARD cell 2-like [Dorcoceras hygrometricum]|uniref:Protein ASPARTIC PROTEASE IN GUARD cell 2-like n=1 Tax=Dorcoceras hygrometricum TaxID=472368 RepID=A0A2Z6ZXY8_9LAMI|nr:protein ASPARTIC PROTEASE IN GUARD cell 2-like [Dorcoceras hygrometricum]
MGVVRELCHNSRRLSHSPSTNPVSYVHFEILTVSKTSVGSVFTDQLIVTVDSGAIFIIEESLPSCMDSDLVIYRTTLVRTFQVVTICRVDKSEILVVQVSPHYSKRH